MPRFKYFVFLALNLCGCDEFVVDVKLPEFKPSLVVNGAFGPMDSIIVVDLSQDKDILDNSTYGTELYAYVTGATVNLYRENLPIGTLSETIPGVYSISHKSRSGETYRIKASKSGFEPIEATTIIPRAAPEASITEITFKPNSDVRLSYTIHDAPGRDYYEIKLYVYMSYQEHPESVVVSEWQEWGYWTIGADDFDVFDDRDIKQFSDELFDGRSKEFTIEFHDFILFEPPPRRDTARFRLDVNKLTETYYQYLFTSGLQQDLDGSPYVEPVQIQSNVKNGFGIFGSYNAKGLLFALSDGERVE